MPAPPRPPSWATSTVPKAVPKEPIKVAMAQDDPEELHDPNNVYLGHIEELKTDYDILTKIAQKNTQKDKALKYLKGVIRRLQVEENQKTRRCWKGSQPSNPTYAN